MSKALYTGSFDPVTNGHIDIIKRAAKLFNHLVVGVIANPQKTPLFTVSERVEILEDLFKDVDNISVDSFCGLLADYVNENNFTAVVRGLRAITDFEYEISMAQMNAHLFNEGVESIFLMTSPGTSFVSSSMIKEVVSLGGKADGLVPDKVLSCMKRKYLK
ncbi:pantetheine-phosphate adenylyltransferase [Eubacteriales bacterium KG127]